MNQSEFAAAIDVGPQDITNWKRRGMPPEHHAKVARIVGHSVDELLGLVEEQQSNGGTRYRLSRIPVVGTAQLGREGFWLETEHPVGHSDLFVDLPSKDPNAYAVRVIGDSMHPRIKSGEFVVVEPNHSVSPGDEVLVVTRDGRSMVKELASRRDGLVALNSVNGSHERLTLQEAEIEKIHYVAAITKSALVYPG